MDRTTVIHQIGVEQYAQACRAARQAALDPHYGTQSAAITFASDIPHTIVDLVLASPLTPYDQLQLVFQLYYEMPCYALLMYLKSHAERFIEPFPQTFWCWIRHQLESPDSALSPPVTYALWCDFFEDPETVEAAWAQLLTPLPAPQALRTILIHSGPVPFHLKRGLYATLITDPAWHYFIFRSLLHSQYDVYGKLDKQEARKLLARLSLPPEAENVALLKQACNAPHPSNHSDAFFI